MSTNKPSPPSDVPDCPECGGPMMLRTNHAHGQEFWSCIRFPKCRGTLDAGAHKDLELEIQDIAGYWGGMSTPTPTKKDRLKNRKFTDEERTFIHIALIEANQDVEKAVELYNKYGKDNGLTLRPITPKSIKEFRKRNLAECFDFLTSELSLGVFTRIMAADSKCNDQTQALVAQYCTNRSQGMPTQRSETVTTTLSWEDRIKLQREQREKYGHDGVWYNPTEEQTATSPADTNEEEEG